MTLHGKTALVTGSSRGIGRAVALRLAADGANVVVNYRADEQAASDVVDEIERGGGSAVAVRADVADPAQISELFETAQQRLGRPDIVVNNAGTARFGPIAQATDEDFRAVFDTNVRAGFVVLREAANRISDDGRIVAISAGVARIHSPDNGLYAASKAAVEQFVRVLARELGPRRITVNSVLPGPTRTDVLGNLPAEAIEQMAAETPLGRLAEPEDIADIVGFLASSRGRWVTGQAIGAGGGAF